MGDIKIILQIIWLIIHISTSDFIGLTLEPLMHSSSSSSSNNSSNDCNTSMQTSSSNSSSSSNDCGASKPH